jgi:hypothetical protein
MRSRLTSAPVVRNTSNESNNAEDLLAKLPQSTELNNIVVNTRVNKTSMIKNKLIALAVACAVIPVAGIARPADKIDGNWLLNVKVTGFFGPSISAVTEMHQDGTLLTFDYASIPAFLGGTGNKKIYSGKGRYVVEQNGLLRVNYQIELADNKTEVVTGEGTVSDGRFTGTAKVQFLDESRKTLYAASAVVEGYQDRTSRLTSAE